ncbi:putative Anucleate primary sterigmata protein A [Glarea lozoyensis 74030]|uniref:Putative Anucleate primary sterigmata protein A n=1 Tax=Glarea lozoyensis (strain ATCC 74030 / MF5533) TaxID=1104152 RepID=H0EQW6_GLAL7|nr:putative Anucleate primary sterigmata protein A [Glarea lozoyensis 74030]
MSPDTQDVDPFLSSSTSSNRQRFSPFDAQLFALGQDASPDQAKHALESHLAETERRIQEASKLGTALVQQRKELSDRLRDVEKQQSDAEISPELQQQLLENSRLEIEAEGFSHRLRSLDESEHRYKDENWDLETRIHEYMASAKESADREKKLTHSLNILQVEKSAAQKELDEIKLSHAKLSEDHLAAVKHHDVEFGSAKRSLVLAEQERTNLQRKVDELAGQNTELAKAIAHQRGRMESQDTSRGLTDDDFDTAQDDVTPEHSPPPSPVKGTPRHSMLESETLKSSLHHAHRMIQTLKGTIHREKTEKLEMKRMLQDARDELDARRVEGGLNSANGKRSRKVDSREFKKPARPGQLGGLRNSRNEIIIDDTNWEEDNGDHSPSRSGAVTAARVAMGLSNPPTFSPDSSDHFDTANETSDAAFETANERGTETEDFQTGVEDMGASSDELTEKEDLPAGARSKPTRLSLAKIGNRQSYQSTASTSGEDYDFDEVKTPTVTQPQRLKLRVSRGGNRRSRQPSEEPSFKSSPAASFANSSTHGTPQASGQTLFAELADMSDEEESITGTPSRSGFTSPASTPAVSRPSTAKNTPAVPFEIPPVPKLPMVDSSTMTDVWEPETSSQNSAVPILGGILGGAAVGASAGGVLHSFHDRHSSTGTQVGPEMTDSAAQWHDDQYMDHLTVDSQDGSRPISMSTYSDSSSQYDPTVMDERLASFPSPPLSRAQTPLINLSAIQSSPAPLSMSTIYSEHVEPTELEISPISPEPVREEVVPVKAAPPPLVLSNIQSVDTEPIEEPLESLSPRTPKRKAMIIPRDESDNEAVASTPEDPFVETRDATPPPAPTESVTKSEGPSTPKAAGFLGSVFGRKSGKTPSTPIIAEDETRQSPNASPLIETPESQRPFKELSNNTNEKVVRQPRAETTDESCQTIVTSTQIDEMLKAKQRQAAILIEDGSRSPTSPSKSVIKGKKSQESIASVNRTHDAVLIKRQTSAASSRHGSMSSTHPPLPPDSKQVIAEAAKRVGSSGGPPAIITQRAGSINGTTGTLVAPRSGSSSGAVGSMGPPLFPASAYKNGSYRPRTPSAGPKSPSVKDGTTPRVLHSSGGNGMHSPTGTGRSRRSSVSSFASELETRFNIRGVGMPQGMGSTTDERMINAVTQTMIGEYLWKYTRKAGRGAISENRHRRYFWVHPYTKTLYWGDHDPSSAKNRAELRAKSVPIEAVRVVTDDNPMPPGLHRKSLIIMTPGRAVKFTATTGQRHEIWFNALSYLLLRDEEMALEDTKEVANAGLTGEDVAEFNPPFRNSSSRKGPGSLSSYNSRTTRDTSPNRKTSSRLSNHPNNMSTSSRASMGTLSRLSNYWNPGKNSGIMGSSRSRHGVGGQSGSIYEASEVHDSAEDLRELIERQDRESDRLENVRACCDGKHDVGHLHINVTCSHVNRKGIQVFAA